MAVPTSNASLVKSVELVIDDSVFYVENDKPQLKQIEREPGLNNIGMVAWLLVTLVTPEFPAGRQIVLIANDITHKAGSFGTMDTNCFRLQ